MPVMPGSPIEPDNDSSTGAGSGGVGGSAGVAPTESGDGNDTASSTGPTFTIPGTSPAGSPVPVSYGQTYSTPSFGTFVDISDSSTLDTTNYDIAVTPNNPNDSFTSLTNLGVVTLGGGNTIGGDGSINDTPPGDGINTPGTPGGSVAASNTSLPPIRLIATLLMPFRMNHRNRGPRESWKFLVFGQKFFSMILALRDSIKPTTSDLETASNLIYPTDAQIAQFQHARIQIAFFEELRMRKVDTRWFN